MGLDAVVYCNCFETGNLKELPPFSELVFVTPDGSLDCKSENLEAVLEFDKWCSKSACEHEDGVLLHHWIGNIARVALLRNELSRESEKFPITLEKIIYSGTHAGDYLSLDVIENLKAELDYLSKFIGSNERNQKFIDYFRQQLFELVEAALEIRKPISF